MQLEQHDRGLTTSLANCIKKLLPDENLLEFDKLRLVVKERGRTNNAEADHMVKEYKLLQVKIGTKVLSKKSDIDRRLQELERHHFQQYGKLPCNSTYQELLKEKKLATAVLRNMNIYL